MKIQKTINFYTAEAMYYLGFKIFDEYFVTSMASLKELDNFLYSYAPPGCYTQEEVQKAKRRIQIVTRYIAEHPECCFIVTKRHLNVAEDRYINTDELELTSALWYDNAMAPDRVNFVTGSIHQFIKANIQHFGADSTTLINSLS